MSYAGGLCVVYTPLAPLGVSPADLSEAEDGDYHVLLKMTVGECQAVALALWVQSLGGLGPRPLL